MKDLKFTPGPWKAGIDGIPGSWKNIVAPIEEEGIGYERSICWLRDYNDDGRDEANAQLIAKAPEMYEALKQAKEALSRVSNCNDLATAREYSREALETINKLGL